MGTRKFDRLAPLDADKASSIAAGAAVAMTSLHNWFLGQSLTPSFFIMPKNEFDVSVLFWAMKPSCSSTSRDVSHI